MKEIKGFKDYYITKDGEVYSMYTSLRHPKKKPKKLSKWNSSGYWCVTLMKDKKEYKEYVHTLILKTFVGERPEGFQCRHLNGNKKDNRLENLKWGSCCDNQNDRIKHGTSNRGTRHGMRKLTEQQVLEIRKLGMDGKFRKGENGGNYKEIAKKYNIKQGTVGNIVRGITWKWLT